jgi:hypothetical protein
MNAEIGEPLCKGGSLRYAEGYSCHVEGHSLEAGSICEPKELTAFFHAVL